jgi:hypothetical protein
MSRTLHDYAEALREGSRHFTHVIEWDFVFREGQWCACAHGAMVSVLEPAYTQSVLAAHRPVMSHSLDRDDHPALFQSAACPVPDDEICDVDNVDELIVHLNDHHRWTPAQIAAHLDALADVQEPRDEGEWR